MNRIVAIPALIVAVVVLPLVWVGASARKRPVLRVNPKTGNYRPITETEMQDFRERSGLTPSAVPPKAVVDQTEYDFGVMDPRQTDGHVFEIRNEGSGPLYLTGSGTTCKCTEFNVLDSTIPPGEVGRVQVVWKTVFDSGSFHESATIKTNDQNVPEIKLVVRGNVLREFGFQPFQLDFPRLLPGKNQSRTALLFSEKWDSFGIANVASTMPGLTWKIKPADTEALAEADAKSGYQITFTTPEDLTTGRHSHRIRFQLLPQGEQEARSVELGSVANVIRRLSIYGPSLKTTADGTGEVSLGNLRLGQGKHLRLMVKVHDEDSTLSGAKIVTQPDFLQATITPHEASAHKKYGFYDLDIRVPKDAPEGIHDGINAGQLRLMPNHPRIKEVKLRVIFSVVDDRPGYAR